MLFVELGVVGRAKPNNIQRAAVVGVVGFGFFFATHMAWLRKDLPVSDGVVYGDLG